MVKLKDKPETWTDRYERLTDALARMGKWLQEDREAWCKAELDRFLEAGGCPTCNGRGWVVTWDTMDCMDGSCAEYGPCPNEGCTEETRKASGLDLSTVLIHDRWKGVSAVNAREQTSSWKEAIGRTQAKYDELRSKCDAVHRRCEPKKGDKVVLVRGRPKDKKTGDVMPIGCISFVAYARDGRVLLKLDWEDRQADGVWTTSHNLEVVVCEDE